VKCAGSAKPASPHRFFGSRAAGRIIPALALLVGVALAPGRAAAQAGDESASVASIVSDSVSAPERRTGFAIFGGSAATIRDSLVTLARQQLGRRYVFGGTSPEKGFDCSGLIRYILAKLDVKVPRTAAQQERVGKVVAKDTAELRPGDLVTFGRGKGASHIGIYVGEGRFIHASSAAGRVIESPLIRPPAQLIKPWRGARRILAITDTAAVAAFSERDG
jgi:cell wall-associated NlpC family hydrolase